MPIIFKEKTGIFPFEVETVGIDWVQEPISRPNGYHTFHLLEGKVGTGLITLNHEKIMLEPGDLLLIAPQIPHHYHGTSQTLWQTNFLTFMGDGVTSLEKFFNYHDYLLLKAHTNDFLARIFAAVEKHTQDEKDHSSSLLLYELLGSLKEQVAPQKILGDGPTSQQLLPVIDYIKQNFAQPLTLNQLAKQIYVSPQYLIRLFQKQLNCSPNDYLTQQRIKAAKALLIEQPEMNISQIGERCGFNSSSYFIKVFKQQNHLTPKQFRERYKH